LPAPHFIKVSKDFPCNGFQNRHGNSPPLSTKLFGLSPDLRSSLVCLRLPPAPPFVPVAWRVGDRLVRLLRSLCDKATLITVFNPDSTRETPILAKSHAPGSGDRVVLPSPMPCKRYARFGGRAVHVSEKNEHPQSIVHPVREISAVPMISMSSLAHCDVSTIRHQP